MEFRMNDELNQTPPLETVPEFKDVQTPSSLEPQNSASSTSPIPLSQSSQRGGPDFFKLNQRIRNGGGWIVMIGILSFAITLLTLFNTTIRFVIGLGATQFIDTLAIILSENFPEDHVIYIAVNIGLNVFISAMYIILGVFAKREQRWAFLVAFIFYLIDTGLVIWTKDFLSIVFHIIALVIIMIGYISLRKKEKLTSNPDQNIA
jgi:hypothetical protein